MSEQPAKAAAAASPAAPPPPDTETDTETATEPAGSVAHGYPAGEHLEGDDALAVTRARPSRVVLLAGPPNCGKTTLVASLYERFHAGPFAGYLFAGSRTLVGLEQRCHFARRASGRERPDTPRTTISPAIRMLHLRLAASEALGPGHPLDVLLTDIYGEAFRLAADSEDECRELHILRRADHVAILFDGAMLREPRTRQEPFNVADALLRLATDTGMLDAGSNVQLVVTKRDLLGGEGGDVRDLFIANRRAWLQDRYAGKVGRLDWFEVAARPEVGNITPGLGLDRLLRHWAEVARRFHTPDPAPSGGFATEFDRYVAVRPAGGGTDV